MTAPTEAEIRALLAHHKVEKDILSEISDPLGHAVDVVTDLIYVPDEQTFGEPFIWQDLRPTERARLEQLVAGVLEELEATVMPMIVSLIVERTVQAALTFAAEYPDAPRVREAVLA